MKVLVASLDPHNYPGVLHGVNNLPTFPTLRTVELEIVLDTEHLVLGSHGELLVQPGVADAAGEAGRVVVAIMDSHTRTCYHTTAGLTLPGAGVTREEVVLFTEYPSIYMVTAFSYTLNMITIYIISLFLLC